MTAHGLELWSRGIFYIQIRLVLTSLCLYAVPLAGLTCLILSFSSGQTEITGHTLRLL